MLGKTGRACRWRGEHEIENLKRQAGVGDKKWGQNQGRGGHIEERFVWFFNFEIKFVIGGVDPYTVCPRFYGTKRRALGAEVQAVGEWPIATAVSKKFDIF